MVEEKLRAFCDGLGMSGVDKFVAGSPEDIRFVGQVMAQRIKDLAANRELTSVSVVRQNTSANSESAPVCDWCGKGGDLMSHNHHRDCYEGILNGDSIIWL